MRIHHWLAPVWATALMVSVAGTVCGQMPAASGTSMSGPIYTPSAPMSGAMPGYLPGPVTGGPGGPGGGPMMAPQQAAVSNVPPGMQPWPQISPYENGFEQTTNAQGLWFREVRNQRRDYYFKLDALWSKIRDPNRVPFGDLSVPVTVTSGVSTATIAQMFLGEPIDDDFDISVINQQQKRAESAGMQGSWGFWNEDGTGFEFNGWWQAASSWEFSRGRGQFGSSDVTQSRATIAFPVRTGLNPGEGIDLAYDQVFDLKMTTESAGTGVNLLQSPYYDNSVFKIRSMVGLRYVFLREKFTFRGADAGYSYTFDALGRPDLDTAQQVFAPYFGTLNSSVESHMAGPQIGFHYTLGGDFLLITGTTTGGLLANHERLRLNGIGFGTPDDPNGFDQNEEYEDQHSNTHVSPLFEQTVAAELPLFQYVPILRKWHLLEEAKFRLGYSILAMFEVSRPTNSIVYQAQPLSPHIRIDRGKWYVHGWHFGIDWKY